MSLTLIKKVATTALLFAGLQAGAQSQEITLGATRNIDAHTFDGGNNSITLGIGSSLNGYNAVYYEHYVSDLMSIQAGVGLTYRSIMNDIGAMVWNDGKEGSHQSDRDIKDHYDNYSYRKAGKGIYLSIAPKFYPYDGCMDGYYLSPMIEYKTYNFKAKTADVNKLPDSYYSIDEADVPRSDVYQEEYMHCLDITSNIGKHIQTRKHVTIDWSFGFGVRVYSAQRLDVGMNGNIGDYTFANNVRKFSGVRPMMTINFAIGGWF